MRRAPNLGLPDFPNPWKGLTPAQAFKTRQAFAGVGTSKDRLTSLERPKLAPARCGPLKATAPVPAYRPYMPAQTNPGHVMAHGAPAAANREALRFNAHERHVQRGPNRIERKAELAPISRLNAPTKPVRLPPITQNTSAPAMMLPSRHDVRPAYVPPPVVYSPPPRQIVYTADQLPAHFADSMLRHSRPLPNIGETYIPSPVIIPPLDLSGLRMGDGDSETSSPKKPQSMGVNLSDRASPGINAINSTAMFWGRDDNASPQMVLNASSRGRDRPKSPNGYSDINKMTNSGGVIKTHGNIDISVLERSSPTVFDVTPPGRERYLEPSHRSDASGRSSRSLSLELDLNTASSPDGRYSPISSMGDFHDSESGDDFYDSDEEEEEDIIVPHPPVVPRPPESKKPSFIRRIFRRN